MTPRTSQEAAQTGGAFADKTRPAGRAQGAAQSETAVHAGSDATGNARPRLGEAVRALTRYAMLWPLVLGLAFSRAGLIVASYGSYTSTDQGLLTDGAMLVALAVLAVFFFILLFTGKTVGKRATNLLARTCIALEALCLLAMAALKTARGGAATKRSSR